MFSILCLKVNNEHQKLKIHSPKKKIVEDSFFSMARPKLNQVINNSLFIRKSFAEIATYECQINLGFIQFIDSRLTCNGDSNNKVNLNADASVTVTGQTNLYNFYFNAYSAADFKFHLDNVHVYDIEKPIFVEGSGTINFYFKGTCFFNSSSRTPAISCNSNSAVLVFHSDDDGLLVARGTDDCPGIGAYNSYTCNKLVFHNARVIAIGGNCAAGIGTGKTGIVNIIEIQGGSTTGYGGFKGAGIGTGNSDTYYQSYVGQITITGGNVTAYGGQEGAGIGSGYGEHEKCSQVGDIYISGGIILAYGGFQSAGIGGGGGTEHGNENSYAGKVNSITITKTITKLIAYSPLSIKSSIGRGNSASKTETITIFGVSFGTDVIPELTDYNFSCHADRKICGYPDYIYPDEPLSTAFFSIVYNKNPFSIIFEYVFLQNFLIE